MKIKKLIRLFLFILSVAGIITYLELQPSAKEDVLVTSEFIEKETDHLTIYIEYPNIKGNIFSNFVSKKINRYIKGYVGEEADEFYATNYELSEQFAKDFPDWKEKYQLDNNYYYYYNRDLNGVIGRYFNVILKPYIYTGGAHGNGYSEPLVFDRFTGKRILFTDIFENPAQVAEALPEMVFDKLALAKSEKLNISLDEAKEALEDDLDFGLKGLEENYDNFMIDNQGMMFVFVPYQAGAYVEGEYQITLDWDKLDRYLKKDFKK